MTVHSPSDSWVESCISVANVVAILLMIGGGIGAFVFFGDALFGKGAFEAENGWVCLGVVAFGYMFRRLYPPAWRYLWEGFR